MLFDNFATLALCVDDDTYLFLLSQREKEPIINGYYVKYLALRDAHFEKRCRRLEQKCLSEDNAIIYGINEDAKTIGIFLTEDLEPADENIAKAVKRHLTNKNEKYFNF